MPVIKIIRNTIMKDFLLKILLIIVIIVIAESVGKKSVSRFANPLKSKPQSRYLKLFRPGTSPLKLPRVAHGIQHKIKRAMRDLRMPFRPNSRPVETRPVRPPSHHSQSPVRVFNHPKLQPVPLSEMRAQQQQRHYSSFASNQGSIQHGSSTQHRYNHRPEPPRPQFQRGPQRFTNEDRIPRQQMPVPQFSNSASRQRMPFRQNGAASIPASSMHSNPSKNVFSPSINGKLMNPEMQQPPKRNRIIDVYHHIPVTQRPTNNMYSRVPVIYATQPPIAPQNSVRFPPHVNRPLSPGFISPEPAVHHPKYHQSQPGIVPQRFPGPELPDTNRFEPHLSHETYKNLNPSPKLPVIPRPNFNIEKGNPFMQSRPLITANPFSQNIPKANSEAISHYQYNPDDDDNDQSGSQNIEDSRLQSSSSVERIPLKDLVTLKDDALKVMHAVDENPLNKTGAVKKYWDFRQENFGLSSMQINAGPAFQKPAIVPTVTLTNSSKSLSNESISSLYVQKNPQNQNNFNNAVRAVKPEIVHAAGEEKNIEHKNISKEFYQIGNNPVNMETIIDLPPRFVQIVDGDPDLSTSSSIADLLQIQELKKIKVQPVQNMERVKVNLTTETSTPSIFLQNIPTYLVNISSEPGHTHSPKHIFGVAQNKQNNPNADSMLLWDQHIKYVPAEMFRQNLTLSVENSYNNDHNSKDSPGDLISSKTYESISEHPGAPFGLYARNKAQYQQFEDTTRSNEFPEYVDGETSEIENKKYFRGPQHFNNNWTVFEEYPITIKGYRRLISTSVPYFSSWITSATTAMPLESVTRHAHQDSNLSLNSHRKLINAWHLANKVLGRRNNTRLLYPSLSSSTQGPEHKILKFTYSHVPRATTENILDISIKNGSKRFFNFKTGTTHSVPESVTSANPKPAFNVTKIDVFPIIDESIDSSTTQTQSSKKASFSVTPNVNRAMQRINARRNQSMSSKGDKRLYYINLKPVTRPYSSSVSDSPYISSNLPSTSLPNFPFTSSNSYSTFSDSPLFSTQKQNTTESHRRDKSSYVTESSSGKLTTTEQLSMSTRPLEMSSTENYKNTISSTSYVTPTTVAATQILTVAPKYKMTTEYNPEEFTTEFSTESVASVTLDGYTNQTEVDTVETMTESRKYYVTIPPAYPSSSSNVDEVTTQLIDQEQVIVDTLRSTKLKMQEIMSRGLRHLMPMVMGLSSDVSISTDCMFSLLRWLRGIRALEQWAVKMMDASSKVPEGILFGTFSTFGSYDECLAVKTPEKNSQIPYIGQYCSINIQPILPENERQFTIHDAFRRYPKLKKVLQEMNIDEDTMAYYYIFKHRIGLCIPSTCTYEDVQNVTANLASHLMMKISIGHCETSDKPSFTKGQIISMSGVFLAFAIVVIGTILDFFLRHRLDIDMDIEEIVRKNSSLRQFSYAFSAYRNACKILNTSIPSNHLSALHGIKFLSLTWIMLGHVYYCKDYLTLAGLSRIRDLGSNLAFQVVLNTAFAADTFFFLSGLLVVYSTFQYLENTDGKFSIVGFYIKRYCRLTPAFLMISGVILLGPLAGSGPVWNETLEPFVTGCQNYWWTNLFYFSNFIPTAKTCVPHGWFLSCDMQFYFISPLIILGLYRRPKMGMLLIAIGIIVSMASTGFLTFLYDLPPVSLFSLPDQKDINEYLDMMGYKPYAHYAAYCIGMATGFLFSAKQKIPISKALQICGWTFTVISCTLVVYGTWNWNSGDLPEWSISVAYATCSRTVWALGIAWLTVICYAGYGGIINSILSWHGFIPLSRLSYLAFLIHPLLMYLYASYVRSPFYFSQYVIIYLYFGHLCITFGLAFIFSLAFELPFLNLEKIISRRLDQSRRKRRASFTHYHPNWQHPEYPEMKDSVVLMRRRTDRFNT